MDEPRLIAGRYELGAFIAQGGFAEVFHGRDTQTGQAVAIKRLKTDAISSDPADLLRFIQEGEVLRSLDHRNIVKLLAAVEDNGEHFLILEYIGGGSLNDLLRKTPQLPILRTLHIALEISDALAQAHHVKVIHRDIKPANILLGADGTPYLADFGIARMDGDLHLTQTGAILGTLSYLPPEAFSGEQPTTRTDIWSMGIMLYEMIVGQLPFTSATRSGLMKTIMDEPLPDLRPLRPEAPAALIDLVVRMLDKRPHRRMDSMRRVAAELETLLNVTPHAEQPTPRGAAIAVEPGVTEADYLTAHATVIVSATDTPAVPIVPILPPSRDNLPGQITPFIGRKKELAELTHLLADPAIRLITIIGPGGMGKTRLGLAAASAHKFDYPDGVIFIPLAPLTDPEAILSAVAHAVDFEFLPGGAPHQQLLAFFRPKTMLLIFDNFEHLLAGSELVSDILQAAPDVKVIATSRTPLDLQAEQLFRIEGLDIPDPELPANTAAIRAAEVLLTENDMIESSAAVKLFVQTAHRAQPKFALADHYQDVVRICQMTDGMPLGIELAASLVRRQSCKEIAARLEKNLAVLVTTWKDVPERHRSMWAVFDYSWNLLTEVEKAVFQQLWVFNRDFTLEAAHSVTGATELVLFGLVDKSMVVETQWGHYELHSLVRQYSEDKLAASVPVEERRALLTRAAEYFKTQRKPDTEWRTMADLTPQLAEFGYRVQLEEYNAAAELLCTFDRYLAGRLGQYELVIGMHESLQGKITDEELARISLNNLAVALVEISYVARGITYLQDLLAKARSSGDLRRELSALGNLGLAYAKLGKFDISIKYHQQMMDFSPSDIEQQLATENIAESNFGLGKYMEAIQRYNSVIIAIENILDKRIRGLMADTKSSLSKSLLALQNFILAATMLSEAINLAIEDGSVTTLRTARLNRVTLCLNTGDLLNADREIQLAQDLPTSQDMCLLAVLDSLTCVCKSSPGSAEKSALRAIALADDLLKKTPELCEENYIRALAQAILASIGKVHIGVAQIDYKRAVDNCSATGVVNWNTQLLDILIKCSNNIEIKVLRDLLTSYPSVATLG